MQCFFCYAYVVLLVKLSEPEDFRIVSKLVEAPREVYGKTLPFLASTAFPRGLIEWLAANGITTTTDAILTPVLL
jgi:hypothetical protein